MCVIKCGEEKLDLEVPLTAVSNHSYTKLDRSYTLVMRSIKKFPVRVSVVCVLQSCIIELHSSLGCGHFKECNGLCDFIYLLLLFEISSITLTE